MGSLLSTVAENLVFVLEFFLVIVVLFMLAYFIERYAYSRNGYKGRILTTKKIAIIGLFSAASTILMMFEIPIPFAPPFYKIDFSEVPVMIVTFAFGPVAGVLTELCKILLKLMFKPTTTAFVGELANFAIGCSLILPASIIYIFKKTKNQALIACIIGTLIMTIFGSVFNAVFLLPKFAELYGMPLPAIIEMGTAINPVITSVTTMAIFAVAPLNLLKGLLVSGITLAMYKKLSPILKAEHMHASRSSIVKR